jgi:nucleotide-binding universal stress UspA family protein
MYTRIMAPLDGSKLAECALPHVEALARGCEVVDIELVRVVTPAQHTVGDYVLADAQVERLNRENQEEAEKYLQDISKKIAVNGAHVETKVLFGSEAEGLAEHAEKSGADLIVIATHGRSGIRRWVWGSVADKTLRSACVPVLMVRAPGCVPGF